MQEKKIRAWSYHFLYLGINSITRLANLSDKLANEEIPKLRANAVLSRNISDVVGDANYLAYSTKAAGRQEAYKSITENVQLIHQKLEELDKYDKGDIEGVETTRR